MKVIYLLFNVSTLEKKKNLLKTAGIYKDKLISTFAKHLLISKTEVH